MSELFRRSPEELIGSHIDRLKSTLQLNVLYVVRDGVASIAANAIASEIERQNVFSKLDTAQRQAFYAKLLQSIDEFFKVELSFRQRHWGADANEAQKSIEGLRKKLYTALETRLSVSLALPAFSPEPFKDTGPSPRPD